MIRWSFLCTLLLAVACRSHEKYDDTRLLAFLKDELRYPSAYQNHLIIFVLQNEQCICTEENIALTLDVLNSEAFKNYNKLLIVKTKDHRILSNVNLDRSKVDVLANDNFVLEKYGLFYATDRFFKYTEMELLTYDMHAGSTDALREILF